MEREPSMQRLDAKTRRQAQAALDVLGIAVLCEQWKISRAAITAALSGLEVTNGTRALIDRALKGAT